MDWAPVHGMEGEPRRREEKSGEDESDEDDTPVVIPSSGRQLSRCTPKGDPSANTDRGWRYKCYLVLGTRADLSTTTLLGSWWDGGK